MFMVMSATFVLRDCRYTSEILSKSRKWLKYLPGPKLQQVIISAATVDHKHVSASEIVCWTHVMYGGTGGYLQQPASQVALQRLNQAHCVSCRYELLLLACATSYSSTQHQLSRLINDSSTHFIEGSYQRYSKMEHIGVLHVIIGVTRRVHDAILHFTPTC